MRIPRIFLFLAPLIFLGAGCFGFGGDSEQAQVVDGAVYKSIDGGQEWAQMAALPSAKGVGSIASVDVAFLTLDPQDPDTLYMGTGKHGMFFSYDNAVSWQRPLDDVLREGNVRAVEVDPTDVCTIYVVRSNRLLKTTDCSRSFDRETYVETRQGVLIQTVRVDWYDPSVVWMGLSNGDILKSQDGGETWNSSVSVGDVITGMLLNKEDSRRMLVATRNGGFVATDDSGESWKRVDKEQFKKWKGSDRVRRMVQGQGGTVVIAATDYGLIRSFDFGQTWEAIDTITTSNEIPISALAVGEDDADRILYAAGSGLYVSEDGGDTWTTSKLPTSRIVTRILLNPENEGIVYLGVVAPAEK